jgi:hypothetical protein
MIVGTTDPSAKTASHLAVRSPGGSPATCSAAIRGTPNETWSKPRPSTSRHWWRTPAAAWAAIGVAVLIVQVIILARWLAAEDLESARGHYSISAIRAAVIWIEQGLLAVGLVVVSVVLGRRCRNARAIAFYTTIFVGYFFTWWLSPIMTYNQPSPIGNRPAVNVVSWGPYLPGWHLPHAELHIETLLAAQMFMFPLAVVWPWLQTLGLRVLLRRFPVWAPIQVASGPHRHRNTDRPPGRVHLRVLWRLRLPAGHSFAVIVRRSLVPASAPQRPFGWSPSVHPNYLHDLRGPAPRTTVHIFRGTEGLAPRWQASVRLAAGIGFVSLLLLVYMVLVGSVPLLGTDPVPADMSGWLWPSGW